jgi:hypothetical protein
MHASLHPYILKEVTKGYACSNEHLPVVRCDIEYQLL